MELVAAAAAASIFVLDCQRCTGRMPAWTDEPPARLPPPALEYGICLAGHLNEVLRCSWYVLG